MKKKQHTGIVVTPYEPPKKSKPKKSLCPEMAQRKIRALDKFLNDGDITLSEYWEMKQRVLDQMLGEKQ